MFAFFVSLYRWLNLDPTFGEQHSQGMQVGRPVLFSPWGGGFFEGLGLTAEMITMKTELSQKGEHAQLCRKFT